MNGSGASPSAASLNPENPPAGRSKFREHFTSAEIASRGGGTFGTDFGDGLPTTPERPLDRYEHLVYLFLGGRSVSTMLKISWAIFAAISALAIASAAADQTTTQPPDDIPSKLVDPTCPSENAGTLEMTTKSVTGREMNVKVQYRGPKGQEQPVHHDTDLDPRAGGGTREQFSINLLTELSDANKVTAEKALNIANKVLNRVCNGSDEERQKFDRWMQGNRESLSIR